MNVSDVAEEVQGRLATLDSVIATYVGSPKSVSVPCAVVGWPEGVDYLGAYGRGMTRVTDWPVLLLAGKVDDRNAFARMGAWADDSSPDSVKTLLEDTTTPYTSCDVITVKSCGFDVITWQGQDFQGALFTIDVAGSGA